LTALKQLKIEEIIAYVAWLSSTQVSIQIMYFQRKHARVLELAKIKRSETNLKKQGT